MNTHRQTMRSAEAAFERKEYATAESLLLRLVETNDSFADAYALLGIVHYEQGRFSNAMAHLEKAIGINPGYAEALLYLAVIYHDLGLYSRGKALEKKLAALPTLAGVQRIASPFRSRIANMHADVGDLYRGLGCYPEAIAQYDQALRLEPGYADIRLKRALCLRNQHAQPAALSEAISELTALVADVPTYKEARLELGISHYLSRDWSKALSVWEKMRKTWPDDPQVPVYLKLTQSKLATSATPPKKVTAPVKKAQPKLKASDKSHKKGAATHKAKLTAKKSVVKKSTKPLPKRNKHHAGRKR